ncbi:hypothetical protein C2W63_02846 [Bacillus velezensis]|nr:hypothetical protein C2W63_02846 [Bacillus velezensis]RUR96969.1 hypothetical protein EFW57_03208 [Bacillus velezensis]
MSPQCRLLYENLLIYKRKGECKWLRVPIKFGADIVIRP